MPCYRPIAAYRAPGGGVAFSSKAGFSDLPLELPCGKCISCKQTRARQWTIRCMHEAQMHEANCFITLTYDQEHVPYDGSLRLVDWQAFAKRLRKAKGKFRYLACGEYGERTLRPHYHALLFGMDFLDATNVAVEGKPDWQSQELTELWGKGRTQVGRVERSSAAYVAQYCTKKVFDGNSDDRYWRQTLDGRRYKVKAEFITMSRRPGLGAEWLKKWKTDVFPHDNVVLDGTHYKVPRYYVNALAEAEQKDYRFRQRRRHRGRKAPSPERLRTMEKVDEARQKLFHSAKF